LLDNRLAHDRHEVIGDRQRHPSYPAPIDPVLTDEPERRIDIRVDHAASGKRLERHRAVLPVPTKIRDRPREIRILARPGRVAGEKAHWALKGLERTREARR